MNRIIDMISGKFRIILKYLYFNYKMLDNTQYIAIVAIGIIITLGSYYMDSNTNEDNQEEINYTKYITTFIVVCSVAAAGLYMYNNPEVGDSTEQSISSEIKKVSSNHDPSVIASLPDF